MDKNGYGPSLYDTEQGKCYICGYQGDTARHEVFYGPLRAVSKKYGAWVNLCPGCHNVNSWSVHKDPGGWLDLNLKIEGQRLWAERWGAESYTENIGRFYDTKDKGV